MELPLYCRLMSLFSLIEGSNLFCFRDEKEKEREGNAHETDALSKYNDWTKATYTDYLAR